MIGRTASEGPERSGGPAERGLRPDRAGLEASDAHLRPRRAGTDTPPHERRPLKPSTQRIERRPRRVGAVHRGATVSDSLNSPIVSEGTRLGAIFRSYSFVLLTAPYSRIVHPRRNWTHPRPPTSWMSQTSAWSLVAGASSTATWWS